MRYAHQLIVVLAALVLASSAGAQTTHPADAKIVVLPFSALNPAQEQAWLGRSIQQSVLADLTAAAPGRIASADVEVTDMSAAAEIGRHSGAAYVVHGSFTTVSTSAGEGMRIMGEVVDSASGRPVASFKATGLYSEIFRLEDQVASQIRQHMPGVLPSPLPQQSAPQSATTVAQSEPAPSQQPPPQVNEYYSTYSAPQAYIPPDAYYNYNYATPYYSPYYYGYGYGYPYGYFGLGVGTAFFFGSFHDHHDHFHDHGGFNGGHPGGGFGGHPGGGGVHVSPHVNSGIYNAGGAAHMGAGAAHMGAGAGGHR